MADGVGSIRVRTLDGAAGTRPLPFAHELVVDLFAGAGGASSGIRAAYREPDVAVNHDRVALAVHRANHPTARHFLADVFEVDPLMATGGNPVGLLWASPDCRHHSRAKGGKPRSRSVRALAWVVIRWALVCRPRVIELENVEEFQGWCPLGADGRPIASRKGETYRAFFAALSTGLPADHPAMAEIVEFLGDDTCVPALVRGLGYQIDSRVLRACDYGAPTIRKRLFIKARCDGRPLSWPAATHAQDGRAGLATWRAASECIDFSKPGTSLFERRKPVVANTCRRVAQGLWRHVFAAPDPYLVECANDPSGAALVSGSVPQLTTTERQLRAVHITHLTHHGNRSGYSPSEPIRTITAANRGEQAMVTAHFLEQAYGGFYTGDGRAVSQPLSTVCCSGANQRLVSAFLVKYYRTGGQWQRLDEPMHTVPTKDRMGLVRAVLVPESCVPDGLLERARRCAHFLHQHLPERFPQQVDLILVGDCVLVDITLRMLEPIELARGQGFPSTYILDRGLFETRPGSGKYEWRPITKSDQVRLVGNSVCPDIAEALVREDLGDLIDLYRRQAA